MPKNTITFTIEGPAIPAIAYDSLARVAADAWGCSADQIHLDASSTVKVDENSNQWETIVVMKRRARSHGRSPVGSCLKDFVFMPGMKPLGTRQG